MNWTYGKWSVFVQEMRYGSIIYMAAPTGPGSVSFMQNPALLTNLEVDYKIIPRWTIGVGANNIGNKYPTRVPSSISNTQQGLSKYASYSPYGFNDGMYYVGSGLIARTRRLRRGRLPRRRRSGICHSVLRPVSSP